MRLLQYCFLLLLSIGFCTMAVAQDANIREARSGKIEFHSDAPKELISASSTQLRGALNIARRTFAFKVSMATFQGFNSPLQREHFNENYMETNQYPEATFSGKIIEDVDLTKDGTYEVRAKGRLSVHGLFRERIIKSSVTVKNRRIQLSSTFIVLLADHNIKIPRVVYEKLSPQISVEVQASLEPQR
jgi:polyisoprenoid-binding protein YceI